MPLGGDVIELVHEQTYLGQQVNNVYFFEAVDGTATLTGLATWFETNVVPDIKGIQNDEVTHINLRLRNLFDLGETYEEPLTGVGALASSSFELPAFVAYTARLDHTSGDVRPGFKRWAGVSEDSVTDSLVAAVRITAIEAICANLVNPPADVNATWAHVIVGRVCDELNPVVGAVPRCLKYVLPRT